MIYMAGRLAVAELLLPEVLPLHQYKSRHQRHSCKTQERWKNPDETYIQSKYRQRRHDVNIQGHPFPIPETHERAESDQTQDTESDHTF